MIRPLAEIRPRRKYISDKREFRRRIRIGHHVARAFVRVIPPILSLREIGELMHCSIEAVRITQNIAFYKVAMRFRETLDFPAPTIEPRKEQHGSSTAAV
jgi:hypothetical protein